MLMASDLFQRYHSLISGPVASDTCISGECVSMLFETPWVKMMVVRYQVAPNICTIEIEVSLPQRIIEPSFPPTTVRQEEAPSFIDSNLAHLNYLLRLQESGFSLGILSSEGIWSAVLKIKGTPDEKLFETILPPDTTN